MKSFTRGGDKDPQNCFEAWLDAESAIGAKSTFFFWPGLSAVRKRHYSDCPYNLSDRVIFEGQKCTIAEVIREIDGRGWEIGLHSSWFSYDDADEIKRQKEALERTLQKEVLSVRQHYLHYDIRVTPRVHSEAGFAYDSSLGFNDNIGFRFGTSYPWHLYDLKKDRFLDIVEIPNIVQDGALLLTEKGMRLDEDTAFLYIKQAIGEVSNVGGVITLVWHPHRITQKSWWNLYIRTLEYLKDKNPWFATVKEIGEWFKEENRQILNGYREFTEDV